MILYREAILTSRIDELRGEISGISKSPRRLPQLEAPKPKRAWDNSPTMVNETAIRPPSPRNEKSYPVQSPRKRRANYNPHNDFSNTAPPRVNTETMNYVRVYYNLINRILYLQLHQEILVIYHQSIQNQQEQQNMVH